MRKLLPYILFIVIVLVVGQSYRYYTLKALQSQALLFDRSVSTIIVGDSHTQTALNPALLANSVNISISDENYLYSYAKLRMLLQHNKVDTVVLGFSWHNILRRSERFVFDRSANAFFLDNYFMLLDPDVIADIADYNSNFLSAYMKYVCGIPAQIYSNDLAFKQALGGRLQRRDFKFIGRYYHSDKSVISSSIVQQRIRDLFYSNENCGKYAGTSPLMLKYLFLIAGLCEKMNVRLVLFNAPVYPDYKVRIPGEAVQDFESVKKKLFAAYPAIEYLDLSGLPLDPSCYGDGDHVNALGAAIVTEHFSRLTNEIRN